ncbi:MAG: phosphatase PAP2 family protein [Vicinamibacterales bacterium]
MKMIKRKSAVILMLLATIGTPAALAAQDFPQATHNDPFGRLFRPDSEAAPTIRVSRVDALAGTFPGVPSVADGQNAPVPAKPEHTGFRALLSETGSDFKAFPRRTSTWVILGVGAAAAAAALPIDDELNAHLAGSSAADNFFAPGKYLGSFPVQVGTAAGLYVVGRYMMPHESGTRTNKVSHLGFDMTRALIVSQTLTQGMKLAFRKDRPTGKCCGLPSGHASAAFATAAVIERHLGYRGAWPAFVVAAYVATSRLHDNVHFLSDVLLGSALGMASGWTVVGRHGKPGYAMFPAPTRGGMMISFVRTSSSSK